MSSAGTSSKPVMNDDGLGVGIVNNVFHLWRHQTKINRHDNDSGFGRGQEQFADFNAIFKQYRNLITFSYNFV